MVNIGAGRYHSIAVTIDGFVYCWGNNMNKQLGSKIEKSKTPTLQKHLLGHGISFINSKYDKSYFISACQDDEPDIDYYRRIIELDKNKRSVKEISKTRITYEEEKKNKMVEIAKTK